MTDRTSDTKQGIVKPSAPVSPARWSQYRSGLPNKTTSHETGHNTNKATTHHSDTHTHARYPTTRSHHPTTRSSHQTATRLQYGSRWGTFWLATKDLWVLSYDLWLLSYDLWLMNYEMLNLSDKKKCSSVTTSCIYSADDGLIFFVLFPRK